MAENIVKKIAIITGSTRAKRVGPGVTNFVMGILETQLAPVEGSSFSLSPIDLADFKLPVFDEKVIPAVVLAVRLRAQQTHHDISYGIQGGKTASDALKTTLEVQQLKVVETRPMLTFPTFGYTPPHTAPSVQSALQVVLVECVEAWATQKDEILKGFYELKKLVIAHNNA